MPASTPPPTEAALEQLKALARLIRARRKALRVSSTAAAEAAGLSRVTLHRIEKGEPSVSAGAWANVLDALGLTLSAQRADELPDSAPMDSGQWVPVRVRLADYPQLQALAWQVHGTDTLTPGEALDIYERNARHLQVEALSEKERGLLTALRAALGKSADV